MRRDLDFQLTIESIINTDIPEYSKLINKHRRGLSKDELTDIYRRCGCKQLTREEIVKLEAEYGIRN